MAAGFQRNSLRHLDKSCLNNRSWNIYWGKVFNKRCFNLIYFIAPLNSIDQLTTILQTYWFSDRGWHSSQTTSYSYTTSSTNSSETPVEDNQFKLFVIDIYISSCQVAFIVYKTYQNTVIICEKPIVFPLRTLKSM